MANIEESVSPAFKLFYKEQWLCFAAFSMLSEEEINLKLSHMDDFIESMLNDESNFLDISPLVIPENRTIMKQFAKSLKAEINWHTIIPNFNYEYIDKSYKIVGYFLIRLIPDSFENLGFDLQEIRPNHLEYLINLVWGNFRIEFSKDFFYDEIAFPYSIAISSGYSLKDQTILWTDENCQKYKKEIVKWADIYSGDFSDFKDDYYDRRIQPNLSNRTSEMHVILRKSALIYMDPHNYERYYIQDERTPLSTGYIYFYVIKTICSFHTIKFALFKISEEIDDDALNLVQKEFQNKDLGTIKDKLDKTTYLKESLDVFIKPYLTDSLRNQRMHYSRIQQCCKKMYSIHENLEYINRGIEDNLQLLNSIFIDSQNLQNEIEDEKRGMHSLQNLTVTLISLFFGTDLLLELEELLKSGNFLGWPVMDYFKLILMFFMFAIFIVLIIRTILTQKQVRHLKSRKLLQD